MTSSRGTSSVGRRVVMVVAICASLNVSGCAAPRGSDAGGGFGAHIFVDPKQHADVITLAGGGPAAKALSLPAAEREVQTRHVAQKRIAMDVERGAKMGAVASFSIFAATSGFALVFPYGTPEQRAGGAEFADALAASLRPAADGRAPSPIVVDIGPADRIVIERSNVRIDALARAIEHAATRLHGKGAGIAVVVSPDPESDWGTTVDVMAAIARSGVRDVRLGLVE